ncbi:uncharacterized protein [Dermacentor albipictus]|uniref:uncharacterized protein n=1 Tax=Dermacentor albipictus TaxID=60249 RepID=UPI0031FC4C22
MASDDSNTSSSDDEASGSDACAKPRESAVAACPSPTELLQSTRVAVLCNTVAVGTFCLLAVALLIVVVNRQQAAAAAATAQPTTSPSEEAVERRRATEKYRASDAPVVPASVRFVCVYRDRVGQPGLNLRSFPYAYCHHLAYCCLSVLPSRGERAARETLAQLGAAMGGAPFSLSVIVGGSSTEDPYLLALLLDTESVQRLVERLALINRNGGEDGATSSSLFSRVYLHWKRPQERHKAAITRLAEALRRQLKPHSLRLGLVVDGDTDVAAAFDFPRLLDVLGDRGLLAAPQSWSVPIPERGGHHSAETLSRHAGLRRLSEKHSDRVCHALSVAAVASEGSEAAIDVSYGSVCNMNFTNVYSHGLATVGVTAFGDAVSFLKPARARQFAAALCKRAKTDCVAFWDPECDDYAGRCGGPSFPLIKAVVGTPVA